MNYKFIHTKVLNKSCSYFDLTFFNDSLAGDYKPQITPIFTDGKYGFVYFLCYSV